MHSFMFAQNFRRSIRDVRADARGHRPDWRAGPHKPGSGLERHGQRPMEASEFQDVLTAPRSTSSDLSRLTVVRALVGNVVNPRHVFNHSVKFSSARSREKDVDLLSQQ